MTSIRDCLAVGDVVHERHLASPLDGDRDLILVAAAGARDPPGADLALLRDEAAQDADVLVVDLHDAFPAEVAVPAPGLRLSRADPLARPRVLLGHRSPRPLERDVVVRRGLEVGLLGLRVRGHELRLAAILSSAEELDAFGDDLHGLTLRAVLGLPLAPVEASVDADRAALGEVLGAALALVSPDRDVEVVRLVAPLAGGRVLLARIDGEPELADRRVARRVPQLRVLRQVPDEDDSVDVRHLLL